MKKTIFIALFLITAAAALAGCSGSSEEFAAQSYTADAASIKEISIDIRDRTIELVPSDNDEILIDCFESDAEYYSFSVSDKGALTLTSEIDKSLGNYVGIKADKEKRTIALHVPNSLLSSLTLSTTNGNITLPEMSAESINLYVNNGDINFERLNVESSLSVETKNGNIHGSVLGGYDDFSITCEIKKGDTDLPAQKDGGSKRLYAAANNGDINIEFIKD